MKQSLCTFAWNEYGVRYVTQEGSRKWCGIGHTEAEAESVMKLIAFLTS